MIELGSRYGINKKYILERITEEEIFSKYLGIYPKLGVKYRNPLRKDNRPDCNFFVEKGRLRFRDWARGTYDCFDVVQEIYGVGFQEAINIIANDFNIVQLPRRLDYTDNRGIYTDNERRKPVIEVKLKSFTKEDANYLLSFGIGPKQCKKFGIRSIEYVWMNGKLRYRYQTGDPCIGYYYGINKQGYQKWKIYYYKRSSDRFLTNTNRISGLLTIPDKGDYLVITKSMKDVIVLDTFDVPSIAFQGESVIPRVDFIEELYSRFQFLFTLYDFDYTGIKTAALMKRRYNTIPLFLTNGRFNTYNYKAKDIADYRRDFGESDTLTLINSEILRWIR